jgi:hypothetical protein
MKKYLNIANILLLLLACSLGLLVGTSEFVQGCLHGKAEIVSFFVVVLAGFRFIVEAKAMRMIPLEYRKLWITGNPFVREVICRLFFVFFGGWWILGRFKLGALLSHVVLAVVVSFLVGSFFEAIRLLRGGK